MTAYVSILTRPESRMLRFDVIHASPPCQVSILTRPESRMLQREGVTFFGGSKFQSSPGPKAGCYFIHGEIMLIEEKVSILTRPESRMLHD